MVTRLIAVVGAFVFCTAAAAQSLNRFLNWSSLIVEMPVNRFTFAGEVENSHLPLEQKQNYFTVLMNAEWSLRVVKPSLGCSYWLLCDRTGFTVPEWRPHQQVYAEVRTGRFLFSNRTRIENRLIRDTAERALRRTSTFFLRPRIMFQVNWEVSRNSAHPDRFQLVLSQEILALMASGGSTFDENRLYFGCWYSVYERVDLRFGYLWLFSAVDAVPQSHILYLTVKWEVGKGV